MERWQHEGQRLYRIWHGSCDGKYICARTIARMRQHSDKEYSEQDPKMTRQTILCKLVDCAAFVMSVLCAVVSVCL